MFGVHNLSLRFDKIYIKNLSLGRENKREKHVLGIYNGSAPSHLDKR
jgi:hypothetical protein